MPQSSDRVKAFVNDRLQFAIDLREQIITFESRKKNPRLLKYQLKGVSIGLYCYLRPKIVDYIETGDGDGKLKEYFNNLLALGDTYTDDPKVLDVKDLEDMKKLLEFFDAVNQFCETYGLTTTKQFTGHSYSN